ncbi:7863_t:CDS:2 [Cetraspora pellucida]|uniref:7863_t:CDS:1 n=1 Tax=Cetraspora pellucida TaxID=1433469 RepID=A0A9N9I1X7_9GLOM|nr:7863_t:CDS:2 [Cetraspora pellucida]
MKDAQSTIDSLRELNSDLIRQITELRKKFAEIETENIKLKQDKEEIEARFVKLEWNDKDTATENAELKARVAKLEQKQLQNDKEKSFHIAKLDKNSREIKQSLVNIISLTSDITDDILNFDICEQAENNSNICQEKFILLEEKNKNNFLNSKNKEQVSKEIIQSIKMKLQDQEKLITLQFFPKIEFEASENKIGISSDLKSAQYPNLCQEDSNKNNKYYEITDESLYLLCKLDHNNNNSIEGRYKVGSYNLKCEQCGIKVKVIA